ncbi:MULTISPECIES: hypothetical protein [unclassified Modestobacter]
MCAQQERAAELLAAAGWRVALARADAGVDQLWRSLGAPAAQVPA